MKQSYDYSDIGLVPTQPSEVASRDDVDTSVDFLSWKLSLPILIAPMESVVGLDLCQELERLGGLACLPRTKDKDIDYELYSKTRAIGIPSFSAREEIKYCHFTKQTICIDTANGFSRVVGDRVKELKKEWPDLKIITGNVASVEGYLYLSECGVDAVRVGIGSGANCTTSLKTGVGVGQFSLIREIAGYKEGYKLRPLIIADGGIKGSREICLAIAAGSDVVMCGRIFAGTEESPGPVVKHEGRLFKQYAGQASKAIKRSDRYIEGRDSLVGYAGKLEEVWHQLREGIQSSCSYMNCKSIDELRYLPEENFVVLSNAQK